MTAPGEGFSGPWPAPAKLNLMLRILGRRADGYHLLQTVFQFLDHGDRLWLRPRADGRVRRRSALPGVTEGQDLTVRAARALQGESGTALGVDIALDKRLPLGGGLGGGSSDAATVLLVLDRLWGLHLGLDRLAEIALGLGADVPFFVRGRAAWGEGVGERLTPVAAAEPWYLVLIPSCQVSTAAVFDDAGLTRDSPPLKIADFVAGTQGNDCTGVVRRAYPEVARALDWLQARGGGHLTGTGACVFAPFEDRAEAEARLAEAPWRGFVARGRNRSPLHRALAREFPVDFIGA